MRGVATRIAFSVLILSAPLATAEPYDLRLAQLGNPTPGSASFAPDASSRFRAFALELAASLNSISLMPPGSLGHSGFAVAIELAVAAIQDSKVTVPTSGNFTSPLLIPSVHLRKGLPFSLELGGKISWLEKSRMMAATLEVRWAFLEGFVHLPDASIRGHVTRLVNARDLNLTTGGLDVTVGKRFPVAGSVSFIPYAGWNIAWVAASTGTIDFSSERDANASLASPSAQLDDTGVFRAVTAGSAATHRFFAGVRFGAGVLRIGVEGSVTLFGAQQIPDAADPSITITRGLPILAAFGSTLGLSF